MKKVDNFQKAVQRLEEAVRECADNEKSSVLRDGLIQRFEFTFELSWKALKEYLIDQGVRDELQFPKQVLKTAYESHMIHDEKIWLAMLEARNSTSHIYDDLVAERIGKQISETYIFTLQKLAAYFISHN